MIAGMIKIKDRHTVLLIQGFHLTSQWIVAAHRPAKKNRALRRLVERNNKIRGCRMWHPDKINTLADKWIEFLKPVCISSQNLVRQNEWRYSSNSDRIIK